MADNRVRILATLDDKVSGGLDRIRDRFDTMGKSKGFQSIIGGVGLGIGAQLWSQFSGRVVDVLGDMVQAARDDQVSIQKLGTALEANIPAWDGNTAAIERVLKSRIKLGFSDDEQRESLATLVRSTKDVNKALFLEAGAMDIARARNVDLATASDALAKAYAGNTKQLKSLIPGLDLGKNSTEAIANAFKAAGSAAADYAATDEGKVLVAQTKVNESMEQFGYMILPAVTDALVGTAGAVVGLTSTLDLLQHGVADTTEAQQEQLQGAIDLTNALGILFPAFTTLSQLEQQALDDAMKMADGFDTTGDNSINMAEKIKGAANGVGGSMDDMGESAVDFRDKFRSVSVDVIASGNRIRDKLVSAAEWTVDNAFGPLMLAADLYDNRLDLLAAEETARTAKSKTERHQARDDVIASLNAQATTLIKLGERGELTAGQVAQFETDVKRNYKNMSTSAQNSMNPVISKLKTLAGFSNKTVPIKVLIKWKETGWQGHAPGTGPLEFEEGGRIPGPKGQPVPIVAHGGEWVVSNDDQDRMFNGVSLGGGSRPMAAAPAVFHLYIDGREISARVEREQFYRRKTAAGA